MQFFRLCGWRGIDKFNDRVLPLDIIWKKAKYLETLYAEANALFEHANINDLCKSNWRILMQIIT